MKVLLCVDDDRLFQELLASMRWCVRCRPEDRALVFHVMPLLSWMRRHAELNGGWAGRTRTAMAEVEELLEEAAQHLSSLGISVETLCREGQPVQEILRVVRDRGVELIVIGTVGRGRREDFLIGSVSQRVKASTERDMLFVRGGGPPGNSRFRAILGVDGSPGSLGAVEAFAKEVQAERADIRVVHVREALGSRPDQTHRRAARSLSTHSGTDYGEEALSNALEILEAHGLSGTTEERRGRPAAELLEAARDYGAHLIVMGSRGLTRPPGMLTGSVTQRVVRHASSSVLCSRRRESVPSVLDS